ncbi:MAG: methylenetetrahydrofolate--tRNA-(uracil(54)-C(5))-methyltransferase (FADH(2)-oxidizing) TrmFO [Krumholzibacteria bacterium]|nr:methylenetetrahydrofolate--tRNA-(uracil(54)-C(5))-methyltransferase (FADH(2)-oxidizing) TrmFO [Candidatus Krumholzibacteria bacterium]
MTRVTVVGGGLAGSEAALQLARRGVACRLVEMRPGVPTPAHRSGRLAEIVCSNSLKSTAAATPGRLLKDELDLLGCRLLACARRAAVPAGAALAVDRDEFSAQVEEAVAAEPLITVERGEVTALPAEPDHLWLLATGPLTGSSLVDALAAATGAPALHFFDAIAPTVTRESLDLDVLYRAARYDKGEADYLNAALDPAQYAAFRAALAAAERAEVQAFDKSDLFAGCQPIEEIAAGGPQSLAFGPLRPVGLEDPRTGRRAHAVVQLRQENRAGTLYGLVGFQTRLKQGAQREVFRMIPGLENAEFVRYGQLHRNFYLDAPRCLGRDFALAARPDVFVAGQMTGVEGYVESIASGLVTAWHVAYRVQGRTLPPLPPATMLGALLGGFLFDTTAARFCPMNANFGLLPELADPVRAKRDRKLAKAERALAELRAWVAVAAA